MRPRTICLFVSFLVLAVGLSLAQIKKPLTNDDVIQMVKAGFQESMIVKAIEANDTNFDVSVQALMDLKNAGVTQTIIEAMLAAEAKKKAPPPAANSLKESSPPSAKSGSSDPTGLPDEVGVYIKVRGNLKEMEPEIVTWRTGGVMKSMMIGTKGHTNGVVNNKQSPLQLATPLEFVIRCLEGTSAAEYQLLRLDEHGDRREFRMITGGYIHSSGGAQKNAVAFQPEKLASRTYKVTLTELKKGEYGWLPPGAVVSQSAASQGKIYTFRIIE